MDLATVMRKRVLARLPEQRTGWYQIKAQDDGKAVVRIYDTISWFGVTADDFVRELAEITAAEIEVQINSPGGDAFDGVAIFNALRTHPARVTTRVDGVAASAASIIAQAGDHRVMMSGAQMMIHEAWGMAIGPASEMRAFADQLDKLNNTMARLYANRAGGGDGRVDEMRELMAVETWFTDEETVEAGLADEVFDPAPKEAAAAAAVDPPADPADRLQEAVRAELGRLGVDLAALPNLLPTPPTVPADPPVPEDPPALAGVDHDVARDLLAAFDLQERETING